LWTDYISAFGAAVGILVAASAFVVALHSARDSRRSADAAETTAASAHEQLVLARAEHEQLEADRRRRPIIERIHVGAIASGPGEEDPPAGVFSIGLTNTGDRDLQDAVLTILFDRAYAAQLTKPLGSTRPKDLTIQRGDNARLPDSAVCAVPSVYRRSERGPCAIPTRSAKPGDVDDGGPCSATSASERHLPSLTALHERAVARVFGGL
jgi:hypothetical protein